MRKKAGFTLLEVMVVIAIVLILAAIVMPVYNRAKEKSHEATCVSNLRQMWMSISMYRQDWDGIDTPDHPYRMGLPSYSFLTYEIITKNNFECRGHYKSDRHNYYQAFWGNDDLSGFEEYVKLAWIPFAKKYGDNLMLIGDHQHQKTPFSRWSKQRYINMSLQGQLQDSYCIGDPSDLANWMKE